MAIQKRIVAEISKNWDNNSATQHGDLLSQRFEHVIAVNADRGYELESWRFSRVTHPDTEAPEIIVVNETIIAVFVQAYLSEI